MIRVDLPTEWRRWTDSLAWFPPNNPHTRRAIYNFATSPPLADSLLNKLNEPHRIDLQTFGESEYDI
jgi:hypothetical protein